LNYILASYLRTHKQNNRIVIVIKMILLNLKYQSLGRPYYVFSINCKVLHHFTSMLLFTDQLLYKTIFYLKQKLILLKILYFDMYN